jgi:uncharacterized protein
MPRAKASKPMLQGIDWSGVEAGLRATGYARLGKLLDADACRATAALYESPELFRKKIQMQQFRFGRGEYQYFSYPLPNVVETMRNDLYAGLAPIATRWNEDLKSSTDFPPDLATFLATCHEAGQTRPTPLLLRYRAGDFNCLHQDLYGDIVFPFQVIVALTEPGVDFEGGELLLIEQQPRAQSIGHVIRLQQGEAVVITTRYRPAKGTRGFYKTNIRHGVSVVSSGERFTLGVIFHDAK